MTLLLCFGHRQKNKELYCLILPVMDSFVIYKVNNCKGNWQQIKSAMERQESDDARSYIQIECKWITEKIVNTVRKIPDMQSEEPSEGQLTT